MGTAGEAGSTDEIGIKAIFIRIAAHPTHYSLDVVDLCRVLRIIAAAVIGAYYCITCIEQSRTDSVDVCPSLTVVAEPSRAIDVDDDGITLLRFRRFWDINVEGMIGLSIACVVDVSDFFRILRLFLALLVASKTEILGGC